MKKKVMHFSVEKVKQRKIKSLSDQRSVRTAICNQAIMSSVRCSEMILIHKELEFYACQRKLTIRHEIRPGITKNLDFRPKL